MINDLILNGIMTLLIACILKLQFVLCEYIVDSEPLLSHEGSHSGLVGH